MSTKHKAEFRRWWPNWYEIQHGRLEVVELTFTASHKRRKLWACDDDRFTQGLKAVYLDRIEESTYATKAEAYAQAIIFASQQISETSRIYQAMIEQAAQEMGQ